MAEKGRITTSECEGSHAVTGEGDLDLYVVEHFQQALSDAVASGQEIVVDLRSSSYMDTAIIAALVPPAKARLAQGSRLKVLVTEGAYPQYVLKITGFADLMDIEVDPAGLATGNLE
jgi:anti-anti-sigma factor